MCVCVCVAVWVSACVLSQLWSAKSQPKPSAPQTATQTDNGARHTRTILPALHSQSAAESPSWLGMEQAWKTHTLTGRGGRVCVRAESQASVRLRQIFKCRWIDVGLPCFQKNATTRWWEWRKPRGKYPQKRNVFLMFLLKLFVCNKHLRLLF